MALRYTFSGGLMLLAAKLMGAHLPRGKELWQTALYGIMALGIGTGTLCWAELTIPSGLAALFCTTSPFWMVGIEAMMPEGEALHGPTIFGMLVGVTGVAFLAARTAFGMTAQGASLFTAFAVLQLGLAAWSMGSILQRKQQSKAHPFVSGAVQQFAVGLVYWIATLIFPTRMDFSPRGITALLYLAIFGGIVGYSAFVYSMANLPVAVASLYNYINPMVAVALGWLFFREPFGIREALAMVMIFVGVAIVKRKSVAVEKLRTESPAECGQYGE
jgi:drug/metabolite transporter (DMT)-like permease